MHPSTKYSVMRTQPDTNIRYYVTPSFKDTRSNVQFVESEIVRNYFQEKQSQCMYEIHKEDGKVCSFYDLLNIWSMNNNNI